jgi:hypothetical protein
MTDGCKRCNTTLRAFLVGKGACCYYCGGILEPIEEFVQEYVPNTDCDLGTIVGEPIVMIDDDYNGMD